MAKIFDTARGLEGLVRNAGVHACAVIMSAEPLLGTVPLWRRDDGAIITGWDYPSCEAIGLLKMDFLGLRNLTVIGDAIDNIRQNRGEDVISIAWNWRTGGRTSCWGVARAWEFSSWTARRCASCCGGWARPASATSSR